MSADFINDLDAVDPTAVETTEPAYPIAQWLNGDPKLAAAGGVAHTGGLVLPAKYVEDGTPAAPGWTRTNVAFSSGKTESVLAAQKPRLAVIRTRFRWFVVYNGVTTFYPRADYVAESGMRGHMQALCGVNGFDFPIVVTFKGKASQEFERLLREFSQKVFEAAAKLARAKHSTSTAPPAPGSARAFPRFAFYLRLAPSPHIKAGRRGQESIITPPQLELPSVISDDFLGKSYVGRERLVEYQQIYHAAAEWGAAWDKPRPAEPDEYDAPAEPDEYDAPAEPDESEPSGAVDVLTLEQAKALLAHHKVDPDLLRQALREQHGSAGYMPRRDTALVRRLVAQHSGPPAGDAPWPPDDF